MPFRLPRWLCGKESACQCRFLGWEDALEKELAVHSSIPAWEISWTEEPGGLQSVGLQRIRHDSTHAKTRKQHGVDTQVHLCPSMSGISAEPILAVNILAHTCSYLIILVTCRSVCMNPDVSHRVHKV